MPSTADEPTIRISAKLVGGGEIAPQSQPLPGYLLLVVDGSGSMSYDGRWELVRRDLRSEIQAVAGSTPVYVHVIKFGTLKGEPTFSFIRPDGPFLATSSDELTQVATDIVGNEVKKGLLGEPVGGETPLWQSMSMAADEAKGRLGARSIGWARIVIFSDGEDNMKGRGGHTQEKAVQELIAAKDGYPESFEASIRPYGSKAEALARTLTKEIPFLKLGTAVPPPPPKPERFDFTIAEPSIAIGKVGTARVVPLDLVLSADSAKWIDRLEFRLQGVDKPLKRDENKLYVPIPASPGGRLLKLTATSSKDDFNESINLIVTALELPPNVQAALKLPEDCRAWYCRAGEPCGLTLALDAKENPSWTFKGAPRPIEGVVMNHAFPPGEHTVTVTAKAADGRSDATVKVIAVNPSIQLEIDAAPANARFDAGKPITLRVRGDSPGLIPLAGVKRTLVWTVNGTVQQQWNDRESIEYRPSNAGPLRIEAKCVLSACGLSDLEKSAVQNIDVSAVPGIDLVPPQSIMRGTTGNITVIVRVAKNVSAVECLFSRDGAAPLPSVRIPVKAMDDTVDTVELPVPVPPELLDRAGLLRVEVKALERLSDGTERGLVPERKAEIEVRDPNPNLSVMASKDRCSYGEPLEVSLKIGDQDRVAVKSIRVIKNGQPLSTKDLASGQTELKFPLTPVLKDGQRIELIAQCLDGDGRPVGAASMPTVVELSPPEPEIVALDGQQTWLWDDIDGPRSPRVELKVPHAPPGSVRVKWDVDGADFIPDEHNEAVATIKFRPRSGKEWNVMVKATATLDGLSISAKPLTLGVTVRPIDLSIDLVDTGSGVRPRVIDGRIRLRVVETGSGPVDLKRLNWRRLSPTGAFLGEGSWSIEKQGDVLDLDAATQVGELLEVTPSFTDLNDQVVAGPPVQIPVNPAKLYLWGVLLAIVALGICCGAWFIFSGNELWRATYRWKTTVDSVHQIDEIWSGSIKMLTLSPPRFNPISKQATIPFPGDGPPWVLNHAGRALRFGGNAVDEVELVGPGQDESGGEPRPSYRQPEGSPVTTLSVIAPSGESDHISAEIAPTPYEPFIRWIGIVVSWTFVVGCWLTVCKLFRFI